MQAALQLAYGLYPPGYLRRAVLISDGLQTNGNVLAEANRARDYGVRLHVMPYRRPVPGEVAVRELKMPDRVQVGETFEGFGVNSHTFLIMVYLGGAIGFNAFLIKGFMDTVPASLDESAKVDGASPAQIFFRIVFPLARPVLAVIFIITFINIYSEFILARTLIRATEQFTLAVGLQLFVESEYAAKWGSLAAAAIIGAAPIVLTFLVAQKQIIGGLTSGAVKG